MARWDVSLQEEAQRAGYAFAFIWRRKLGGSSIWQSLSIRKNLVV